MKLISWNVNGIRAALKKGLAEFLEEESPDILCLQETKARPEQVELPLQFGAYKAFWNSAEKPGYSGTAIFSKTAPIEVTYGLGIELHDKEGRVITAEFADFYLVTVYTVNAQDGLKRINYRLQWDQAFREHLIELRKKKPVIFCGDLNVAHHEIDLARPQANRKSAGFSDEERQSFTHLIDAGFTDTFRYLHPDTEEAYSWWSYRGGARQRNVGWRLDYFGISKDLIGRLETATILPEVLGSDHCPVVITLK